MRLFNVPYYCGGRFLAGLYNFSGSDLSGRFTKEDDYLQYLMNNNHNGLLTSIDADKYQSVPSTLGEFQRVLKYFLYVERGISGFQGVVYAVTNRDQREAQTYLEKTGFKCVGEYSKYGPSSASALCKTWVGDYCSDIYPILSAIPSRKVEVQDAPKRFGINPASASSTIAGGLSNAAPERVRAEEQARREMLAQMQNSVRYRQEPDARPSDRW